VLSNGQPQFIARLGRGVTGFILTVVTLLERVRVSTLHIVRFYTEVRSRNRHILLRDITHAISNTMLLTVVTGAALGSLAILLFPMDFILPGLEEPFGFLFFDLIFRELAPLFASLVFMTYCAGSLTVRLTQMKNDGELRILEVMGFQPELYLYTVRLPAGLFVLPVLSLYLGTAAYIAGMLVLFFQGMLSPMLLLEQSAVRINLSSLGVFFIKTISCGFIIYRIALYEGMGAPRRPEATTRVLSVAMTRMFIFIVAFHFMFIMSSFRASTFLRDFSF
jgi:phospholipid/cholesterol/gamma-HCH transport system permease protein